MSDILRLGAINKNNNLFVTPSNAYKTDKYMCIDCKKDVKFCKGMIRKPYFAHKKENDNCCFYNNPTESQLHENAKLVLKYILENKIPLVIDTTCVQCKQNYQTPIPEIETASTILLEYRFEYNGLKIADVAYVENNEISCIFEVYNTHATQEENRPEPWFELDAKQIIEVFNNYDYGLIRLTCIRNKLCDECLDVQASLNSKLKNGIIYFNQRGAGCGKTYESIQLIQNDVRFSEKETYIYLTKMHTAKEVIFNEFCEQLQNGHLSLLEIKEKDNNIGKQRKFTLLNKKTNKEITIIIGTIDSFNYAVVNKNKIIKQADYFKSIVNTIKEGYLSIKNNTIKYASKTPMMNESCLIIVDEAQDLGDEYIKAFNTIIQFTNIDVYVIGDKLQSIWGEHNIHTFIDKNNLSSHIERSEGINKVMRFHNNHFINFINDIVPFEKFDLPKITGICNGCCKYKHENVITPYELFQIPKIYSNDLNHVKIDNTINDIIDFMNNEINKYNYLPNNFMFIFPLVSKNVFALLLEIRLQQFWVDKMNDINYQDVLMRDEYWKNKINDNMFYKHAYLHKSDEGKAIDLSESKNATRIMSIHASKGNGCEVVFVLGITENILKIFSKEKCNLVYESLLHVALTRQKKSLYIGIEINNDDICKRFTKYNIKENINVEPDLYHISKYVKMEKIQEFMMSKDDIFNQINSNILEPNNYITLLPNDEESNKKAIIDWGHHQIRFAVMMYNIMLCICENEIMDKDSLKSKDQFLTIINKLTNKSIEFYNYIDFNAKIREMSNNIKYLKPENNNIIPLLVFDKNENTKYYKYTAILKNIILSIQNKIKHYLKKNKLPPLCPLESVILLFLINLFDHGSYSDISIMDVYSIMYCYDSCSSELDDNHTMFNKCICSKCFNELEHLDSADKIKISIKKHYDYIEHIKNTYNNYKKYISTILKIKQMKYNIFHCVNFGKYNDNFCIINEFKVIGYSEGCVIYFMIKPQFSNLNFNDVMYSSLLQTFIMMNCSQNDSENYKKFNGKKIFTCIFTFDSIEPIFYELNIDLNNLVLKQSIKQYLLTTFSQYHDDIYKFYKYCRDNKPTTENSIDFTLSKIKANKYTLPRYIEDYFRDINKEINACKSNKDKMLLALSKVNDKDVMILNLNSYLEKEIDFLLKINTDEFVDY
jgi:hypothetical protein